MNVAHCKTRASAASGILLLTSTKYLLDNTIDPIMMTGAKTFNIGIMIGYGNDSLLICAHETLDEISES